MVAGVSAEPVSRARFSAAYSPRAVAAVAFPRCIHPSRLYGPVFAYRHFDSQIRDCRRVIEHVGLQQGSEARQRRRVYLTFEKGPG